MAARGQWQRPRGMLPTSGVTVIEGWAGTASRRLWVPWWRPIAAPVRTGLLLPMASMPCAPGLTAQSTGRKIAADGSRTIESFLRSSGAPVNTANQPRIRGSRPPPCRTHGGHWCGIHLVWQDFRLSRPRSDRRMLLGRRPVARQELGRVGCPAVEQPGGLPRGRGPPATLLGRLRRGACGPALLHRRRYARFSSEAYIWRKCQGADLWFCSTSVRSQ